jgi:hypothetical protein
MGKSSGLKVYPIFSMDGALFLYKFSIGGVAFNLKFKVKSANI